MGLDVDLGEPLDLWAGLTPDFLSSGRPWRLPEGRPLRVERATVPPNPVEWGAPSLSLHESVADLLDHIFDYSVTPMVGLDGPHSVTAGALMAGKSLATLEARLKVDLTIRPAPAFLLVRLIGSRGIRYYTPEWHGFNRKTKIVEWLTPEGRAAMARLRLREMRHEGSEFYGDLTARQARRFIEYFHDLGTHVVRSLSHGEQLFQVFEANADHLAGLKVSFAREAAENRFCGPMAYATAHLTRRPWVTSASPILLASAQQDAHHEIWMSDLPGEPLSLLAPRAMPAWSRAAALASLPARGIVGVSFACQALYLEDHRADAWTRIMRAGLCQRFPAAAFAGWRARARSQLAGFLASAALAGDEALCKPATPVLPDLALALDFTAPGRITNPSTDCLAFFATTDPGTGRAAGVEIECPSFDPASLTIPFVDGALCVTDREGERFCLVEGVWLGAKRACRPDIAGAPAEPGAALLIRNVSQLAGLVRLMEQLQRPGLPPEVSVAMKRAVAWLAEATQRQPELLPLRWQALQIVRSAGRIAAGTIMLDRALKRELAQLLEACIALLALPVDSGNLRAATRQLSARLRAFYARLYVTLKAGELDSKTIAAGEALQRRFASFARNPDLPEPAKSLFSAGAALCQPPDLHRMPHGIVPGGEPYSILWNALLGLRASYAECRATLLAMQCRTAEAVALLEREILGSGESPSNPASDVLASLDALGEALPPIDAADRKLLLNEMNELLNLCRSARLLQLANADEGSPEPGPQLHRLLLLLEILELCRAADIPLTLCDSLAPTAFAARIDQALTAMAEDRRLA